MDLKKEGGFIGLLVGLCSLPYTYFLLRTPTCGWDCPWYAYHLQHTGYLEIITQVEPLYFWLFKPLTLFVEGIIAVDISQMIMLWILLFGVYLLGRRMGLTPKETAIAVLIVGLSQGTSRLWYDTLRNFLAFALLPYFIYFYTAEQRKWKPIIGVGILMLLSHRAIWTIVPIIIAYELALGYDKEKIKRLAAVIVLSTVVILLMNTEWELTAVSLHIIENLLSTDIIHTISQNLRSLVLFGSYGTMLGLLGWSILDWTNKTNRFIGIFFIIFLIGSLLLNSITLGRLVLIYMLPMGLMGALSFRIWNARHSRLSQGIFYGIIGAMLFSMMIAAAEARPITNQDEIDFIKSIDIPEGSYLIAPSRLAAYVDYVWHGKYVVEFADYYDIRDNTSLRNNNSEVYRGINPFGEPVYYIDGNHWTYNESTPLSLYRLDINGSKTLIGG